jgi:hypothetical protein
VHHSPHRDTALKLASIVREPHLKEAIMDDAVKYSVIVAASAGTWTVTTYDGGSKPTSKTFKSKVEAENHAVFERKRLGIGG